MTGKSRVWFAATAITAIALTGVCCESPNRLVTEERLTRFEASLTNLQSELGIPGMAVAVLEDGELVWSKGFGFADRERSIPATPDTPFQLASVTKALAAIVTLRLEERGLLKLNDRVADFYPAFPYKKLGITNQEALHLVHLITHTSDEPPGSRYRYDGDLFCGLDHAALHASGRGFKELFFEEIGAPLGMKGTAPNPIDLGLMDRFQNWLRARGEEPVLRDGSGTPYEVGSLWRLPDEKAVNSYLLLESLIPGALAAAGKDSTLFSNRKPHSVDPRSTHLFNEFFQEDNTFLDTYARIARPYRRGEQGDILRGGYRNFFSAGAGMISTVNDLAAFDIALDSGVLLEQETLERAWTPFELSNGQTSTYGLGWFVEEYGEQKLIWHGGEWDCIGALYLKVPAENLTFIALANSRTLSSAFAMGAGEVLNSGLGAEFLRIFVFEPLAGVHGPDVVWRDDPATIVTAITTIEDKHLRGLWWRQLRNMETMFQRMGETEVWQALTNDVHAPLFERLFGPPHEGLPVVAEIAAVGNADQRSVDFTLEQEQTIRIYAIGEITRDGCWDWGWIERAATGEKVWEMSLENTVPAGGSGKNRKADFSLRLPAGSYRLHYQSDESHAYMEWNDASPDHLFWGIRILLL